MSVSHSMVRNLLKASMKNEGNLTKNSKDVRLLLDLLTNYTEVEQI
jgi:hypothetical protein